MNVDDEPDVCAKDGVRGTSVLKFPFCFDGVLVDVLAIKSLFLFCFDGVSVDVSAIKSLFLSCNQV